MVVKETAWDIVADVRFFPTEAGGRHSPTPPDRFSCIFEIDDKFFDCRLHLAEVGSISPGESARVPIQFLSPELVRPRLSIGTEFHLKEFGRIAHGVVRALS